MSHFWARASTESEPKLLFIGNPPYSHKPITDQSITKTLQKSPKLPIFHKNILQEYLEAKIIDYDYLQDPLLR